MLGDVAAQLSEFHQNAIVCDRPAERGGVQLSVCALERRVAGLCGEFALYVHEFLRERILVE